MYFKKQFDKYKGVNLQTLIFILYYDKFTSAFAANKQALEQYYIRICIV